MSKAGKTTHGLGRFFSSLCQRAVPRLVFVSLALLSTKERRAFPARVEQVVRTTAEQETSKPKAAAKRQTAGPKRKPGRPKGSKTKPKADVTLSPKQRRSLGRTFRSWLSTARQRVLELNRLL